MVRAQGAAVSCITGRISIGYSTYPTHRAAISGMIDGATHQEVADAGISISLEQLRARVGRVLARETR